MSIISNLKSLLKGLLPFQLIQTPSCDPMKLKQVSDIIVSKISDYNKAIAGQEFYDIDFFEPINGILTYNRNTLVHYIKIALATLEKEQNIFAYGSCDTIDILFIVRKTPLKRDHKCPTCGLHITRFNSRFIGISETTGDEFECILRRLFGV